MPYEILVVDDDPAVRASLERVLAFEGYAVRSAADGVAALTAVASARPDAVVLDLQMPQVDGLEVCRRLRSEGCDVPVLMLTARDTTPDRVTGLDAGADDYLPKPFALEELLARLRSVLRRGGRPVTIPPVGDDVSQHEADEHGLHLDDQVLRFEDLTLDTVTRDVTRGGRPVVLTRTEHDLLELFLRHPRRVLTRAQILREVWGFDFDPASNTLEVYVGYLRRKLEEGGESRVLMTVRGVGYVLRST